MKSLRKITRARRWRQTRARWIWVLMFSVAVPMSALGAAVPAAEVCRERLQTLGSALEIYLRAYRALPERLSQLYEAGYVAELGLFSCVPGKRIENASDIDRLGDFVLARAFGETAPTRLLWQKQASPDGMQLAFFSDRSMRNFDGTSLESRKVAAKPPRPAVVEADSTIACREGDICREARTGLPLRVMPRSFSNIYTGTKDDKIAYVNVPAFHPLYVFAMEGVDASKERGWYQVGKAVRKEPLGWMRAKDVLEWRQALIVSYTHPGSGEGERQRVLMFEDVAELKKVVEAPDGARKAVRLYRDLREGSVDTVVAEGVVSKEPEGFADIMEKFYMMPIVNSQAAESGTGEKVMYLQVAAGVLGVRGEDRLDRKDVANRLMERAGPGEEARKVLGLDVVFVMDMTASMQPFMDRTKQALTSLAASFPESLNDDPGLREKVRFGLIGYRDDVQAIPGIEFASRNFTPDLVDAAGLAEILAQEASATIVGSRDHAEEMFAGVKEALDGTKWNKDSLKFVIVVGDASSHPVGHVQNTTGLNAEELRRTAGDKRIHIGAIHLKDPAHPEDHPIAAEQLKQLTRVEGSGETAALVSVDVSGPGGFEEEVKPLVNAVAAVLRDFRQGDGTPVGGMEVRNGPESPEMIKKLFDAALVEYLGRNNEAPKDVVGWVSDRDLTDPGLKALEPRVLLTRAQLSDLITALERVVEPLQAAVMTQKQFFDFLQAVAAQAEKDPERLALAQNLKGAGLLPAFIESLPYKSEILELSEERFGAMTAEEKNGLLQRLNARLARYVAVNEAVDGWVKLNEDDDSLEEVYPVELESLP